MTKMALLLGLMIAVSQLQLIFASCCPGKHVVNNECVLAHNRETSPSYDQNDDVAFSTITSDALFPAVVPGDAVSLLLQAHRAHSIEIEYDSTDTARYVVVYEGGVLKGEFQAPVSTTLWASGEGDWQLSFANWGAEDKDFDLSSGFEVTLQCANAAGLTEDGSTGIYTCDFSPCTAGTQRWKGECKSVVDKTPFPMNYTTSNPNEFFFGTTLTVNGPTLAPMDAIAMVPEYKGTMRLEVVDVCALAGLYVMIYEKDDNGVLFHHSNFLAPFQKEFPVVKGNGLWHIVFVSIRFEGNIKLDGKYIKGSIKCPGKKFLDIDTKQCLPPTCTELGTHLNNAFDDCIFPDHRETAAGFLTSGGAGVADITVGADAVFNNVLRGEGGALVMQEYRSHKIVVSYNVYDPERYLYVYEGEVLKAEFQCPFENQEVYATDNGEWKVVAVHWGTQFNEEGEVNARTFEMGDFNAIQKCLGGDKFVEDDATLTCDFSPCEPPLHRWQGVCTPSEETPAFKLSYRPAQSLNEVFFTSTQNGPVLNPKKAISMSPMHVGNLALEILETMPNAQDLWATIWEIDAEGKEIFYTELMAPFAETFNVDQGSGKWRVSFANWKAEGTIHVDPDYIIASVSCEDPSLIYDNAECVLPPGVCAYDKLGFNPWERWNVFAAAGFITIHPTASVGGRIAAGGNVKVEAGGEVHTEKEIYIPKRIPSWSISAVGNVEVAATGTVSNGGIEAKGTVTATGFTGKWADSTNVTHVHSADHAAAKTYFEGRSAAWKKKPETVIDLDTTKIDSEGIVRIRVQGKVNFVTGLSMDQLAKVNTIVLAGNPVGTTIITIKDPGQLILESIQVKYQRSDEEPANPTFGRVLLHFPEASQIIMDNIHGTTSSGHLRTEHERAGRANQASQDQPSQVSILAPKASVFARYTLMKGGIYAGGSVIIGQTDINKDHAHVEVQPFGTMAKLLTPQPPRPPAKVVWANALKVKCLFGNL